MITTALTNEQFVIFTVNTGTGTKATCDTVQILAMMTSSSASVSPAPLYPLQDFKALHKYCITVIIISHQFVEFLQLQCQ